MKKPVDISAAFLWYMYIVKISKTVLVCISTYLFMYSIVCHTFWHEFEVVWKMVYVSDYSSKTSLLPIKPKKNHILKSFSCTLYRNKRFVPSKIFQHWKTTHVLVFSFFIFLHFCLTNALVYVKVDRSNH